MKIWIGIAVFLFTYFAAQAQNRKAIFVIVDGISADVIEKLPTPSLDAIAARGGYAPVLVGGEKGGYSETPTISAVGYNTVLTGTWANKHNVWDNDIAAANYRYKNIFRLLHEHDSTKTLAVFSSWLDNRTKLVNMDVDYYVDGLELDTIRFPHDKDRKFMERIDQAVTDSAAEYIKTKGPDLTWVYLEYTDDIGHMHGDGPQFYSAVEAMDKKIGQLMKAINDRQQNHKEDWLIIVTTDHGRDSLSGKHHGGQSTRERNGWIVTNANNLNNYFKKGKASIADIMPTVASFLQIPIPRETAMEVDGIPITGKTSASNFAATLAGNKINLTWTKGDTSANARIWISTTNLFKTGGRDEYKLITSAPLKKEKAMIDISDMPSDFYKVAIETPNGFLNRWIILKPESVTNN